MVSGMSPAGLFADLLSPRLIRSIRDIVSQAHIAQWTAGFGCRVDPLYEGSPRPSRSMSPGKGRPAADRACRTNPPSEGTARRARWVRVTTRRGALVFLLVTLLQGPDAAAVRVVEANPETYRGLLKSLRPGDTLSLTPGEYARGLPIQRLSGEAGNPIIIGGPAQGQPAVFAARPGHNTVSIVESRHVVIRDLVLAGNGIPVDAVKAEGHSAWAHDITLENLVIRGHGGSQQTVGISTKCPAWNWVIRGNTILGAGTGIYLGNSDGRAPFVAGLIERNLIVDTLGYNLQIKHQLPRPDIPGMPEGASTTIIRHNVFAKPEAGSAESARPNVLVGHFPLEGPGTDDQYAVYGNFFYQNRHEALFQGEGNVALYSNLFVNSHGDAIRIQPHNDIPRRIDIAYNTVLAFGTGISIIQKEGAPAFPQVVSANAVFAATPLRGGQHSYNLTATLEDAGRYLKAPFAPLGSMDPRLKSPPRKSSESRPREAKSFPDWQHDFEGKPRPPGTIGAYSGAKKNFWPPRLERKPRTTVPEFAGADTGRE